MQSFYILILQACLCWCYSTASSSGERTPLSDHLKWEYTGMNPSCTGPGGGRNPCQDIRICNFAVAALMLGGWPTLCGWVGKGVPKVCCGLPLVLGRDLMFKVQEEKARKRECGRRTMSRGLSQIEEKFFDIVKTLPPVDTSNPDKFDPPLDLHVETMVSPVGGAPSRQGDFPWMVAIYRRNSFLCGGSLIDRIHILSAAHCFVDDETSKTLPSDYKVLVGNINVDMGHPFGVSQIKIHEEYKPKQHYNDIAILTLASEILTPFISHICLPNEEIAAMDMTGKPTTLLGWGDTEFGGRNTPVLHIVDDIPVVSNQDCRQIYRRVSSKESLTEGITDDFLCAGKPEGGKDACQQDSGGPLMYKNNYQNLPEYHPDIPWVLVGIVSFGYLCGEPGYPGVYTKVANYMDWISENSLLN